jgi:hypothetical protein
MTLGCAQNPDGPYPRSPSATGEIKSSMPFRRWPEPCWERMHSAGRKSFFTIFGDAEIENDSKMMQHDATCTKTII